MEKVEGTDMGDSFQSKVQDNITQFAGQVNPLALAPPSPVTLR